MAVSLRFRLLLFGAVAAVAAGARTDASTLILPSDSSLTARSELIVAGRVLASTSIEADGKIWTETAIAVEERLKGSSTDVVTVREPGGSLGGRVTVVFGSPELAAGERVLLFLARGVGGTYRTVDLAAGKFAERVDQAGERFWFRDLRRSGLRVIGSTALELQRDAAGFEREIRGASGEGTYLRPFSEADEGIVESDFTLAQRARIHRWFSFESGKASGWVAVGRQTGFPQGGQPELAAAIAAWTSCPGTKIDYFYAGESTATPAGSRVANGINEVFFNDPLNEIPGSWNGRDGVVAVGGFDALLAPGKWTAGFDADPAHLSGSFDAWVILEGNVVVQDGISPSRGIGSAALAEILAHELGHTLGLGHSAEPRALMYASLQNFGPYLRDDDRLAAQWLYPGASAPAAPAALAAPSKLEVASVTSENVRLGWNDNATGEAFQTIYYGLAGGTLSKLRDVAANVTVANVTGLAPGKTFEFQLTARGPAEESPPSNIAVAAIPRAKLESAFTVGPPTGTAGITTFSFYDQSKGAIVSREWSFGDGGSSAGANPTRVYAQAGSWEVTLRIRDDRGEESLSKRTVTVAAPPPLVADFSWGPEAAVAGEAIRFADRSGGAPTDWAWSFGDGSSSSERNPSKTFEAPGRYSVSLEVASGLQTARISRSLEVGVPPTGSGAAFEFTPEVATVGEPVLFSDRSREEAERWNWKFGDGSSSAERNPVHAFVAAGTYVVTLEVTRAGRSATSVRLLLVLESDPPSTESHDGFSAAH